VGKIRADFYGRMVKRQRRGEAKDPSKLQLKYAGTTEIHSRVIGEKQPRISYWNEMK